MSEPSQSAAPHRGATFQMRSGQYNPRKKKNPPLVDKSVRRSSMKIYVGNLSYEMTEEDLRGAFEAFGAVNEITIIMDRFSGRSKGFGFVEMPNQAEAEKAIADLNGKEIRGRSITVNQARPREERPRRNGDSGGGGGGFRSGSRRSY